ncbi:hypothetical protein DPF_1630 [Desulfoplanes formicivorans]|uniref:Uncharacterized protein n=1 Tax=Desulfoplanes formicivorans TaxID=1592317 RepID=A0A194AIL1_9BACT|nr:hypothetical protein DPF_1630 [Desulfoplanes formicivorans]
MENSLEKYWIMDSCRIYAWHVQEGQTRVQVRQIYGQCQSDGNGVLQATFLFPQKRDAESLGREWFFLRGGFRRGQRGQIDLA